MSSRKTLPEPLTIGQLAECVAERLEPLALTSQQRHAEIDWFLEAATGMTPSMRLARAEAPVPREAVTRLAGWLDRRIDERAPIQYILGCAWFYGLKLTVTPDVLIPRPETELLVEEALAFCRALYARRQKPVKILDVCTGSGAIPLAIKHTLKEQVLIAGADISPAALAIARQNAKALGLDVSFYEGDLFVANPPYVDRAGVGSLEPEVVDHEPHMALFAPGARTSIHARLLGEAPRYLAESGAVGLEIGYGLGQEVSRLFEKNGYRDIRVLNDFAGRERLVWGYLGHKP